MVDCFPDRDSEVFSRQETKLHLELGACPLVASRNPARLCDLLELISTEDTQTSAVAAFLVISDICKDKKYKLKLPKLFKPRRDVNTLTDHNFFHLNLEQMSCHCRYVQYETGCIQVSADVTAGLDWTCDKE